MYKVSGQQALSKMKSLIELIDKNLPKQKDTDRLNQLKTHFIMLSQMIENDVMELVAYDQDTLFNIIEAEKLCGL